MPTSQGGNCDLRPGLPVGVKSDFDPSFALASFAEGLRTGAGVIRGETAFLHWISRKAAISWSLL